jgi:heme exporter protein C
LTFLKKHWWKALCILCLLYVVIAGLGAPLSPGILKVEPSAIGPGMNQDVRIQGYNTHFDRGETPEVWVEVGADTLCGRDIEVLGPDELSMDLYIPTGLSREDIVLHISSAQSGTYLLPDAFIIEAARRETVDLDSRPCHPEVHGDPGTFSFPFRKILYESIRNLYFHVPMWFGMMGLMFLGFFHSIRYLGGGRKEQDLRSKGFVQAGLLFALLGLATGSLWARFTWGAWWVSDPKLNGAAITTLIYLAYIVLRDSIRDPEQRARVAAVYNIFAFVFLLVFLLILPRLAPDSLHPGSGGNPAFSRYDLDDTMRTVFYPAVIGWFLLGLWIAQVRIRVAKLRDRMSAPL